MDESLITVMQTHLSEPPGDDLLFLTEIDTACEILFKSSSFQSTPLFPPKFNRESSPASRKVVIATNVAETSLTIPGCRSRFFEAKCVRSKIGHGFARRSAYFPS
jgi:HrpA-like RNA helicase